MMLKIVIKQKILKHSITTRIKTAAFTLSLWLFLLFSNIPLQQGLKQCNLQLRCTVALFSNIPLQQGLKQISHHVFYQEHKILKHSITTRIKTTNPECKLT